MSSLSPDSTAQPRSGEAFARAHRLLVGAGIDDAYPGRAELERARDSGLDLVTFNAALADLSRMCDRIEGCEVLGSEERTSVDALISAARTWGDDSSLAVLVQLEAKGAFTQLATEAILARRMADRLGPCAPPSKTAIDSQRGELDSFAVIDRNASGLHARPLRPDERDDLAYFLAAVRQAEPEIRSRAVPQQTSVPTDQAEEAVVRAARALQRAATSMAGGDLPTAQAELQGYLQELGWPDLHAVESRASMTWGGPRSANVMRDLARLSEIVDEPEVAAVLYRQANPGGGACGTSTDYRRGKQIRGVIRTVEQTRGCGPVVPERLMDWNDDYDPGEPVAPAGMGPGRLAEAGFDVARLYRGALLTRNRGGEPGQVAAAFNDLPTEHREAALGRLADRGAEDWERRIAAAEGLADVTGRAAIDPLVALAKVADDRLRARTIQAIAAAATRPMAGPCDDQDLLWGFGSMSNIWSRPVDPFAKKCADWLTDDEARRLGRKLAGYVDAQDGSVAAAAIGALAAIAAPGADRTFARVERQAAKDAAHCDADVYDEFCYRARQLGDTARRAQERWHGAFERGADR